MKLFFSIFLVFLLFGCQTIENKTEKIGKKEIKEISKFINQPESELKIVMGEPDEIKYDDKDEKFLPCAVQSLYIDTFYRSLKFILTSEFI